MENFEAMGKTVTYTAGGFEKAPFGTFPAIIYGVAEMGTTLSSFNGEEPRETDNICIFLEFEADSIDSPGEQKIFTINKIMSFILSDKSKLGSIIRGAENIPSIKNINYNIAKLVGKPCMVTVKHSEKGFPSIENVTPLVGKLISSLHTQKNKNFYLSLKEELFNEITFDEINDRVIKKRIEISNEYRKFFKLQPLSFEEQKAEIDSCYKKKEESEGLDPTGEFKDDKYFGDEANKKRTESTDKFRPTPPITVITPTPTISSQDAEDVFTKPTTVENPVPVTDNPFK